MQLPLASRIATKREYVNTKENLTPVYVVILLIFLIILFQNLCLPRESEEDDVSEKVLETAFYSTLYERRIRQLIEIGMNGDENVSSSSTRGVARRCSPVPEKLRFVDTSVNESKSTTFEELLNQQPDIRPGGVWAPRDCLSRHNVAIVIPYRNRKQHLLKMLSNLIPVLKSQEISFSIYLSEQNGNDTFNKGILMNAAYLEALKDRSWDCFVFHDVDIIPENVRTMYTCPQSPRHLSVAIDEMDYVLPYEFLVGGVFVLRTEHFLKVNGYSNRYWGWGSEDDDMSMRLKNAGFRINRPPYNVARFRQIKHEKRDAAEWKIRYKQLHNAESRQHIDGVRDVNYSLISREHKPLFTHLMVDVGLPPR